MKVIISIVRLATIITSGGNDDLNGRFSKIAKKKE
jgi:hypothetical protein